MSAIRLVIPLCTALSLLLISPLAVAAETDLSGFYLEAGLERHDQQLRHERTMDGQVITRGDALGLAADGGVIQAGYRHPVGPFLLGAGLRYAATAADTAYYWRSDVGADVDREEVVYLARDDSWGASLSLARPLGDGWIYGRLGYERTDFSYISARYPRVVPLPDSSQGEWRSEHLRYALGMALPLTEQFYFQMEVAASEPGGMSVAAQSPGGTTQPSTRRSFDVSRSASAQMMLGFRF